MNVRKRILVVALLTATAFMVPAAYGDALFDPPGMLLTWQQDPLTTMTIDWQAVEPRASDLEFRVLGTDTWQRASGHSHPFPYSDRTIHRVELTGLEPGTEYEFRMGPDSRVFRFRTMPADLTRPVRIAVGGDVRHSQTWMERTNAQALRYDPDFVLWGGDLAYADGREDRLDRWYEFFDAHKNTLITEDGRVIPAVAAIGNHEVRGGYYYNAEGYEQTDASRGQLSPFYYALFAFPGQPGYGVLDFGDYLSVILLDTDHNNPVDGEQTAWLEQVLAERRHVPHVFPIYHVPGYPSHRAFEGQVSVRIREHWVPLFEQFGVKVAFENHDHTYKRTHPIRQGVVADDGVVYLGDGCWGVGTREVHPVEETWYLRRAESKRHFILTTIQGRHQHFTMIDENGEVIDEYPEATRP